MSEEKDLSRFLDYRPDLKYEKKRKVELIERPDYEDSSGVDSFLPDLSRFVQPEEVRGYIPSPAIMDAIEVTPTQLLAGFEDLLSTLDTFIDKNKKNLQNLLAKGPSVDEYIEARQSNDANIRYEFEDYHALNIEGETGAEALSLFLDMKEETEALLDFLNEEFFSGNADINNLPELVAEEEERLRNLIFADRTGDADIDSLAEDSHVLDFLNEKLILMGEFSEEINSIVDTDLNAAYDGQATEIVESLADSSLLEHIAEVNVHRFQKEAEESEDAKSQSKRLANLGQKMSLLKRLRALQRKKLKNKGLLKWMQNKNIESDNPMMIFLLDILEGVQEVNRQTDNLTDDLYAITQLEESQLSDFTDALRKKQASRTIHRLSDSMKKSFDFNDKNKRAQAEKFAKHTGLNPKAAAPDSGKPMHKH